MRWSGLYQPPRGTLLRLRWRLRSYQTWCSNQRRPPARRRKSLRRPRSFRSSPSPGSRRCARSIRPSPTRWRTRTRRRRRRRHPCSRGSWRWRSRCARGDPWPRCPQTWLAALLRKRARPRRRRRRSRRRSPRTWRRPRLGDWRCRRGPHRHRRSCFRHCRSRRTKRSGR